LLPVAAELVDRGAQVDFFITPAYRAKVEETGARFRATPDLPDDYFDAVSRRFNPLWLATQLLESTPGQMAALRQYLRAERPATVVYDSMCPWARAAAELSGIPAVASLALLNLETGHYVRSGLLGEALRLTPRFLPWIPRYLRAWRDARRAVGLELPGFPQILSWPARRNVSYTSALFQPGAEKLGDRFHFVGPSLRPELRTYPFPFERLDGERPLIYASLGTVFNHNGDFFRACRDAFGDSIYQLVIALGHQLPPDTLDPLPENVIVQPYVPQLDILQRAALFITHGGMNSVHEGLYYDVPLLLVPQQLEQALTAARVDELGAGRRLPAGSRTVPHLRRATEEILTTPGYRHRATLLGRSLREAGGAPRAAEIILN
jgi:hypothetical protein